jgi:xanthine dehydrogenase YagR molybdenum-binding subunit
VREFAEQTTVATRMMYAAPHRRTTHRLARLDVPTPSWMRAPGECPGMFAPDRDPELDLPYSSRNLVPCLREGAERFGWATRAARRDGPWLVGSGVAASVYPAYLQPGQATARAEADGFVVRIAAVDLGTGARTVLTQVAADALEVGPERVRVEIGDSAFPRGSVAGGSSGTASWGSAVAKACRALRAEHGDAPPVGAEVSVDTTEDVRARPSFSRHAFGAQFTEVRGHADTGEVRVPRIVGVFAAGHILNARTARSQLIGGMTMGISMALHEERDRPAVRRLRQPRLRELPHRHVRGRRRDRRLLDRRGRPAPEPARGQGGPARSASRARRR